MKILQDMIKDLTDITVEEQKINEYLSREFLDLQCSKLNGAVLRCAKLQDADLRGVNLSFADLRDADLKNIEITKKQLDQLIVIEDDE
ncbi:pentapeptide repeat-containing protein [Spiroplasma phoeniceum]|uniref:Pentapeptide repeat-containing protein n=1 Tax=Spiroplasma phoeniceum P40 TaxID=1276259 RepID=A0A345DLE6_9MOLU|nr:pentapeptide repeat-containing protein [Spiroplasma phoeniceum]AXF95034.1 hypothetical protein SDAV_0018 [Spiroplasma phoeniceum P40]